MNYDIVVFDVDGTLIDSEETILLSLQHMLLRMTGRLYPYEELYFALGIPGEEAVRRLGLTDQEKAMDMWWKYSSRYEYLQKPFAGIEDAVTHLSEAGVSLGIVTSRLKVEFQRAMSLYNFTRRFETVICADDTEKHKPNAEPMLELLKRTGVSPSRTLYIGDSVYDMECAGMAGADSALALWGAHSPKDIQATLYIEKPSDIKSYIF